MHVAKLSKLLRKDETFQWTVTDDRDVRTSTRNTTGNQRKSIIFQFVLLAILLVVVVDVIVVVIIVAAMAS